MKSLVRAEVGVGGVVNKSTNRSLPLLLPLAGHRMCGKVAQLPKATFIARRHSAPKMLIFGD